MLTCATVYVLQVAKTNFSVCVVIADNYKNISGFWDGDKLKYPPASLTDGLVLNLQLCCKYYGSITIRGNTVYIHDDVRIFFQTDYASCLGLLNHALASTFNCCAVDFFASLSHVVNAEN